METLLAMRSAAGSRSETGTEGNDRSDYTSGSIEETFRPRFVDDVLRWSRC